MLNEVIKNEVNPRLNLKSKLRLEKSNDELGNIIRESWQRIAPFWPLNNLIACNPLQGFEHLPIEQAIIDAARFFQRDDFPSPMLAVNRETIKWCQAFFDEGQATISMPFREQGFYLAFRALAYFDDHLFKEDQAYRDWIKHLPDSPEEMITDTLKKLNIPCNKKALFLTLLLTTLPGWASYIQYRVNWQKNSDAITNPICQADYLAVRLAITCLLWPKAVRLLDWYEENNPKSALSNVLALNQMQKQENNYQQRLFSSLKQVVANMDTINTKKTDAQFIFCIDVRSEPMRRAIEAQGNYQTYGFAGFFGLPIKVHNTISDERYSSCPVLLAAEHTIQESPTCSAQARQNYNNRKKLLLTLKHFYQALKYNFSTPFMLAEAMGPWCGLWLLLRTLTPSFSTKTKQGLEKLVSPMSSLSPNLDMRKDGHGIPFQQQCQYAESALRMMDLTNNFASLVIVCGHGSTTQNNAYASALDCGACGGNHGASNARVFSKILNDKSVRNYLAAKGIVIPPETLFIAALHNTTTDEITLFAEIGENERRIDLDKLNKDLLKASEMNSKSRLQDLEHKKAPTNPKKFMTQSYRRSSDWAQTRPEWGLARNAAFIIAPRQLTKDLNLQGRTFLHSYNWETDSEGSNLTTILTAPMVVAQWINCQYLFSALDNIAYGSGSKITQNITGKIGIMQGNSSDIMHGLPLQSVYLDDIDVFHEPLRLLTLVYAPRSLLMKIIQAQPLLQKLFGNGWVLLACIEPQSQQFYMLSRDFTWIAK